MTRVEPRIETGILSAYRALLGEESVRELTALAHGLRGRRMVMVNSTATGGGVAEILHRLVPMLTELGVPTSWEVLPAEARFHDITKRLHNALHGHGAPLTDADHEHYFAFTRQAAERLTLDGDIIMIHDPQPAGLAAYRRKPHQTWIWRCHIDLADAQPDALDFIMTRVAHHDAAVYSHATFVPRMTPGFLTPPSIDPFSPKNVELDDDRMHELLAPYGLPGDVPWVTQVSRFDRIKDPLGVIEAFRLARKREDAHLVLAGGSADDDPEGAAVLAEVRERAGGMSDVSVLALPSDAHQVINALQRRSTVIVQKSLREGFALTVSEALWKQRAVVASAVGGIPLQVVHERTGLLVRSVEGCALQLVRALRDRALRRRLGRAGHDHVRMNFLHTRELRDYLALALHLVRQLARAGQAHG
ncbi:MAG: glycosyltransferase [Candidatus Eisenbacteria bacterium]